MNIKSVEELGQLAKAGWTHWEDLGMIKSTEYNDETVNLVKLTYTAECNHKPPVEWNFIERESRGLILCRRTGDVIARPFSKFFNYGQVNIFKSGIKSVYEKMDGSLGISYFLPRRKHPYISTKGSFQSDQALLASEWLRTRYDTSFLNSDYTYMFEIIYPDNRIVVDYGTREDLVLLGCRNRRTGQYVAWRTVKQLAEKCGFGLPMVYHFANVEEIVTFTKRLPQNSEGYVVEFQDGMRAKFKGDEYLRVHRILSTISFKNTLNAFREGCIDQYTASIPDNFLDPVLEWIDYIERIELEITRNVETSFFFAPKESRKEYAIWVNKQVPEYASYMFARIDERPLKPLIYKLAFKKREEAEETLPE